MLCNGDLAFLCKCATALEGLRPWVQECTLGIPRNVEDLETVEFADVLGAIAEDFHLTRCAQVCFTRTEENQAEQHDQGTLDDVLGDRDLEQGKDVSWKKLSEKLICLNRYLFLVTQSPKKNVLRLGFVCSAELALQSDDDTETCDIYLEKHFCRCYELLEHHKAVSMRPRPFDVIDATTRSRAQTHKVSPPRPVTFNHEV